MWNECLKRKTRSERVDSNLRNVISVHEAASILNVSPGHVKNLCARGKIVAKKIGKTWVIDKSRLKEGEDSSCNL
ncbi:helix-turn-helix domain-containing protein [Bacillus mycoides]|uniref:helix-turn-helix domain-containing protein n=1 Tax=Bacillus mycoides TaxID=1405 RepID=UPI001F1D87E9